MSNELGSVARPLRVAIIGAGPSGFYAAGSLLQQKEVQVSVDMYDRLPTPFGLVRYGVAPDHQKIKTVTKVYERTASDPRFRFYGNVDFGRDVTHEDLRQHYDQIVYAVGAQSDRRLNIPGEDLKGSLSATEFVAWYNGHPDFVDLDLDLSCQSVIVVGVGNVAMDVARILAKTVDDLKDTDIADHALSVLAKINVCDIYVLARRGPAQAKFTNPEIKEFGELDHADVVVNASELDLDALSAKEIENDTIAKKNMDILREFAQRPLSGKPRRVHFRFLVSPVEILGDDQGKVKGVRIEKNELRPTETGYLNSHGIGEYETLPAGMVLRSVGYKGIPLADVPYDKRSGRIPNQEGRVVDPVTNEVVLGEYVVGWAKRGPTGIIGTNKPDAAETVVHMLEDIGSTPLAPISDPKSIDAMLRERNLEFVTIEDRRTLDKREIALGAPQGRPRVKLTTVERMLEALNGNAKIKLPT